MIGRAVGQAGSVTCTVLFACMQHQHRERQQWGGGGGGEVLVLFVCLVS